MTTRILQIVPRLSPALDGVGDYSLIIAEKLRSISAIDTIFVVCDPTWEGPVSINGFDVARISNRTPEALVATLNKWRTVATPSIQYALLQLVLYGYQNRGCPIWLMRGLRDWTQQPSNKLVTMFHELDADSKFPWESAFWLCALQRLIIKEIANFSYRRCTNAVGSREKMSSWGVSDINVSPTFSNVGEPSSNLLVRDRKRQVVIFGRPWQREQAYVKGSRQLKSACEQIDASCIVDIGSPMTNFNRSDIEGVPIVRFGSLPADQISSCLSTSVASFLYYEAALLSKSGVYAASCAHGVIPFVANPSTQSVTCSDLVRGLDYLDTEDAASQLGFDDLQILSYGVFERYQRRSSSQAAHLFTNLIESRTLEIPLPAPIRSFL